MKDIERFIETEWRRLSTGKHPRGHERIRVRYGFHYIKGNSRPYFSITADIAEPLNRHNRHESRAEIPAPDGYDPRDWPSDWRIVGGGCCHDDIARVFPELSALIPWHLTDDDGEPMHYSSNAGYWLAKHLGVYRVFASSEPEGRRDGEPEPLSAFKSGIVFGSVDGDAERLAEILETPEPEPESIPDLADFERREKTIIALAARWLEERKPSLARRMRETMEAFRVAYIQPHEYA